MEWLSYIARILVVAVIVVAVAEVSKRHPRYGALLLSLPIGSVLAFLFSWFRYHDMEAISKLSRATLILVPLGMPFFLPFAFMPRFGFWMSFACGLVLASISVTCGLLLMPK